MNQSDIENAGSKSAASDSAASNASDSNQRSSLKKLLVLAAVAIGLFVVTRFLPVEQWWRSLSESIDSLGVWGPIALILVYTIATVAWIPGSVITLGAAAVFGFGWGLLWITIGANLGANLAFLIGRYLARDAIAARIEGNPRFEAIDQAVSHEGWKVVGLTRLSPVFPFNLLNYAFGLTNVRWIEYSVATLFGMLPGTVLYVYVGSLGKLAAEQKTASVTKWILLVIGLLATIAVTVLITNKARQALAETNGMSVQQQ